MAAVDSAPGVSKVWYGIVALLRPWHCEIRVILVLEARVVYHEGLDMLGIGRVGLYLQTDPDIQHFLP